jgi:hypothetical protein
VIDVASTLAGIAIAAAVCMILGGMIVAAYCLAIISYRDDEGTNKPFKGGSDMSSSSPGTRR